MASGEGEAMLLAWKRPAQLWSDGGARPTHGRRQPGLGLTSTSAPHFLSCSSCQQPIGDPLPSHHYHYRSGKGASANQLCSCNGFFQPPHHCYQNMHWVSTWVYLSRKSQRTKQTQCPAFKELDIRGPGGDPEELAFYT